MQEDDAVHLRQLKSRCCLSAVIGFIVLGGILYLPAREAKIRHDHTVSSIELRQIEIYIRDFRRQMAESPGEVSTKQAPFRFGRLTDVLPQLTSPVAYLPVVPRDPFDPEGGSYQIACGSSEVFLLIGMGPDRDLDLTSEVLEEPWLKDFSLGSKEGIGAQLGCPGCGTLVEALRVGTFIYSPTNGMESSGDLLRLGQ